MLRGLAAVQHSSAAKNTIYAFIPFLIGKRNQQTTMMEEPFDPLNQVVTFLAPDKSPMSLPIPTIDAFNDESISICINYAVQVGACTVLLVLLLILTPPAKLRRPSALLHLAALLVCIVRLSLLLSNFLSPLNHFYQFWAIDYSSVPRYFFHVSVASNAFSLLLVVVVESALMHQAWTMVRLWPSPVKLSLCFVSAAISLLTVGWKFAFAIMQSQYNLTLDKPPLADWVMQTSLIMSTISIFWYCALFNAKLVMHLVVNRAILRSPQILTPMEVLVITNGVLMIVPGTLFVFFSMVCFSSPN
jgi:pheromone alpha factor receptor